MKAIFTIAYLFAIIHLSFQHLTADEKRQLSQPSCDKVNGKWGDWGEWHHCSVTCGKGVQKRYRHCDNPRPMYGGSNCPINEPHFEVRDCDAKLPCPVDGVWGTWTTGSCSVSCGTGTRPITRQCNSPPPQHCGKPCVGQDTRYETCEKPACPTWNEWECLPCHYVKNLKACKKKCTRTCKSGNCVGESTRYIECTKEEKSDCEETQPDGPCYACYEKAKSSNANRGLGEYCRVDKTACDGLTGGKQEMYRASGWFYLHCSNDGPWCKPCAEKFLRYNAKCGSCEASPDGPCTNGKVKRSKTEDILKDEDIW